ncbi:MAG TPA: TPM domain-containing protein, partial [Pyrinomonadaceae bacterium]|nr:TPM domain-containing protein [Pyrinomonadaceae bacterium]
MFESKKQFHVLRRARAIAPSRSRLRACALIVTAACVLIAVAASTTRAQPSPAPLPSPVTTPTGYINDYANVIDAQTKSRLETILTNLKKLADIEIAVVTVPTTNGEDIFDYSLAVARGWGIGSKDGEKLGLLLVVAVNDRKYFTQVSRHLEGDLPDGLVGQIQRERLVPQFRRGNY